MKNANFLAVVVGTATLTVLVFGSNSMIAIDENEPIKPKIAVPSLKTHGANISLKVPEGVTYKTGDKPELELTAVNLEKKPKTVKINVEMQSTSVASLYSRLPSVSRPLWKNQQILVLQPGETKVFKLATKTALPLDSIVSVTLSGDNSAHDTADTPLNSIHALSFSTGTNTTELAGVISLNASGRKSGVDHNSSLPMVGKEALPKL